MAHENTADHSHERIKAVDTVRILLAEDDYEMRRLLAAALRSDGYQVTEVETGTELALSLGAMRYGVVDEPGFDIIIADVRMPGPSGIAVLADLHRVGKMKPFILITAFGDSEIHAEAQRHGAAAVFDKPFNIDELLLVVSRLVPQEPRGQELDLTHQAPRPTRNYRACARTFPFDYDNGHNR